MEYLKLIHTFYIFALIVNNLTVALYDSVSYENFATGNGYLSGSDLGADWGLIGGRSHQPKCVDIPSRMTLCRDIGYQTMRLPNLLEHETMQEVLDQARVWVPLLNLQCHPDTKLFLCSLYSPVCLEPSIYPCRSLCEGVKRGCSGRMFNYGFPWPEILKCEQFPDELCIEQVNFEDTANVCEPCKQPLTFESILDSYCWANYVIKVKIRKVINEKNGNKTIILKGNLNKKFFYKPSSKEIDLQQIGVVNDLKIVIPSGVEPCDCDQATNAGKKKTLIMGSPEGDTFVVSYISEWAKTKEFRRAIKAIKKGHDCKKEIEEIAGQTDANNGGLSTESKPMPPMVDVDVDVGLNGTVTIPGTDNNTNGKKDRKKDKGKGKGKKGRGKGKGKGKKGRGKKGKGKKGKGKKGKGKKDKSKKPDPMESFAGIGCIACKQPLQFNNLIEKYCDANFVMSTSVRKLKIDDNGDKRLLMTKDKSNTTMYKKDNMSKRELRKLQPVISGGSSCDCVSANPGKGTLFIMGKKQGGRNVVTFLNVLPNDSEFTRFMEEIEKGFSCSSSGESSQGSN